jgi:hypothetical protein
MMSYDNYTYITGVPFRQLKMQALFPQPPEACKAFLDSNVQEATQEGTVYLTPSTFLSAPVVQFSNNCA